MCDEQISVDGKATESNSPSVIRWNRQRGRNQLQDDVSGRRIEENKASCSPSDKKKDKSKKGHRKRTLANHPVKGEIGQIESGKSNGDKAGPRKMNSDEHRKNPLQVQDAIDCDRLQSITEGERNCGTRKSVGQGAGRIFAKTLVGLGKHAPTSSKTSQNAACRESPKVSKTAIDNLPWEVLSIDDIAKELTNRLYIDGLLINNDAGVCDNDGTSDGKKNTEAALGCDIKEADSGGRKGLIMKEEKTDYVRDIEMVAESVPRSDTNQKDCKIHEGSESKTTMKNMIENDVQAESLTLSVPRRHSRIYMRSSKHTVTLPSVDIRTTSRAHSLRRGSSLHDDFLIQSIAETSLNPNSSGVPVNDDWNDEILHVGVLTKSESDGHLKTKSHAQERFVSSSENLQKNVKGVRKGRVCDKSASRAKMENGAGSGRKEETRYPYKPRNHDSGKKKKRNSHSSRKISAGIENKKLSLKKLGSLAQDVSKNIKATNQCLDPRSEKRQEVQSRLPNDVISANVNCNDQALFENNKANRVFTPRVSIEEEEDWNKDHYCLPVDKQNLSEEHELCFGPVSMNLQLDEIDDSSNGSSLDLTLKEGNDVTTSSTTGIIQPSASSTYVMDCSSSESEDYKCLIFSQEDEVLNPGTQFRELYFTPCLSPAISLTDGVRCCHCRIHNETKVLSQELVHMCGADQEVGCDVASHTNQPSLLLNPQFLNSNANADSSDDSVSDCFAFSTDCPYRRWPENSEPLSYFDQHQMKIRPSMSSFPYVPSPKTCPGTKVRRPSLSPLSLPPPIGCPIQFRMGNTFGQVPDPVEAETDVIKGTGQVDINNTNAGNNASSRTSSATPVEAPLQTTPNKPPVPPYPLGEGFPEIEWSSGDMNNNKMIELLDKGVFVPKPKSLTSPGILGKSASENVRMLAQQVEESRRRTQELKRMNSKNTTAQVSGESGFAVSTPNSFFNRMEKENQMCSVHPLQMQCSPKAGSNFVQGPPAESNKCEVNTEADTVHTTPALNQINSSYSESPERMSLDVDPRLIPQQGRNSKIREAGPALADSPMSWASSVRQPRSLSTLPTILPITALPGISPIMTKGKVPELMNCKLPSASTPQLDIYDQNHNENIKQKQHPRKILKLMQDDGPAFSKGKGGMYPTHDKNSILTPWRGMGPAEKERATFNAQFVPDGCSSESSPVTSPQRKVIHRLTPDTSCHASSMCAPSEQSYNSSYSFDTSQASPLNVTETKRKVEKKAESEGIAGSAREEGELVYDWFEDKPVTKENVISPPRAETSPGDKAVEQPQAVETEYGGAYNPSAYYDRVNHNRFQRLQQVKTRLSSSSAGAAETDRDPLSCVRWTSWQEKFLQRYQSCQVPFIDTHCHLDFLYDRTGFAGTYQKYRTLNKDTFPHNYMGCVAVFCNPRTFNSSGGLWKDILMEHNVWGAIGCHPKCATDFTPMYEEEMIKMLQHEKVAAVGEIGLDFSGSFYKYHETQKNVFARQLKIALKVDKPIVIHSRDAEQECIAVLEETIPNTHQIHRHCFTGSWPEAEAWLTKFPNSFIGLTPLVTYKGNRSIGPREVAARIPLNRLLLETDAPYFVPRQIPRDEVQFSHPGMAITVAEEVAFLKGIPIDTVLEHCMFNTRMMYRLL